MVFYQSNRGLHDESQTECLAEQDKTNTLEEIQNVCNMCNELDALNITLKRQLLREMEG